MRVPVTLLAGGAYLFAGRVVPAVSTDVRVWRMAAWGVSLVVFGAHIAYEHFRLRHAPRTTATQAAIGVAIGAIAVAVAGAAREVVLTSSLRPSWIFALVGFPAVTAIPAFAVAFATAMLLTRLAPEAQSKSS